MLKNVFISMRPKQWTKNLFVFAGIIFAGRLFHIYDLVRVVLAFVLLTIVSGGLYIINDILDRKNDVFHPLKKDRPIARGSLPLSKAWVSALLLIILGVSLSFIISQYFFLVVILYLLLMVSYSLVLKRVVLLDILCIAFGFVLRTLAGCAVIDVSISPWLFVCTLMLALFIAASKRRQEFITLDSDAKDHRLSLTDYSPRLIDQILVIVTACTLIAYTLYTLSPMTYIKFGGYGLVFTIPFVLYGIMRYFYLIHKGEMVDSPEIVFIRDKPLIIDIVLWVVSVTLVIYLI